MIIPPVDDVRTIMHTRSSHAPPARAARRQGWRLGRGAIGMHRVAIEKTIHLVGGALGHELDDGSSPSMKIAHRRLCRPVAAEQDAIGAEGVDYIQYVR